MAPFRMPVIDKYKEMGTIVMGKSEAGLVTVGDKLLVMPNKCACGARGQRALLQEVSMPFAAVGYIRLYRCASSQGLTCE